MKRMKDLLKALGEVKHRRATILVCPRCGKTNIHPKTSLTSGFLPTVYVCEDCGYRGHLITEMDEDKEPNKPS